MAKVDFPASPTDGQQLSVNGLTYTFNSAKGTWRDAFTTVNINSNTPPANPEPGQLWFNTGTAVLYIYYNDGSSSQWVSVSGPKGDDGASATLSSINSSIIPDTDSAYDLGSTNKKFRSLYLSGNTLFLGDSSSISAGAGGEIILPSIKVGTGDNAVKLSASATGALQTQSVVAGVSQSVQPAGGTVQVADLAAMQAISNPSIGDMVSVVSNKTIYMYNGTGFYKIAVMVNESPSAITGVDGSYSLATDGTAATITAISSDPEGRALTWSYAVTSGSLTNGGGATATVTQGTGSNTHIFTITPTTTEAYAGSFSITFSVTDNVNGAVNAVSAFTLTFIVQNSRYTALSVKATNTGSNQTFDDASTSNHTITANGDTTTSTFSPHRHGGYSLGLDGTNDYLQVPQTTDLDLTGDFTVECWAYFNDTAGGSGLMGKWGGSGLFGWTLYATAADFWFYTGNSGSSATQGAFTFGTPAVNQWYHLAVSRTGSTISTYVNGTRTTTITDSNNCTANTTLIVGSDGSSLSAWSVDGYMRDVRIVNGTGLYTGTSITVPTEPLTAITNTKFLLGDLPYFKDQSASNHAITVNGDASLKPKSVFDNSPYSEASHGVSAYFDGTGDYLDVGSSGIANFGTGDFTIEFWVNSTDANALGSGASNIINPISSTGSGYWGLMFQNGKLRWNNSYNVANLWEVNAATILKGSFNHVAVVRNSGAFSIYFNGVSQSAASGTFTDTTNYSGDTGVRIGSGNANNFVGTLSDLRIVSSAVYTTNFTPPSAPLTAITNTKFLLNPETSISDLSQSSEITCFGDAATSTTQVKFSGTKSIYLDGTGDYLTGPSSATIGIGTGDFTIECWFYATDGTSIDRGIWETRTDGYPNWSEGLSLTRITETTFRVYGTSQLIVSSATTITNTWNHLAVVRNSGTLEFFVNGVSQGTVSNSTNMNSSQPIAIGSGRYTTSNSTPTHAVKGYIQDFRVSSIARYTSTFTPPTSELQG